MGGKELPEANFVAGRTAELFSVAFKPAASAMEKQPRERSVAGAEAYGEKQGLSQAAEERIEDRISLLLRCSRRASAPTREAQGSNSVSLADLGLRNLRHHQFNRFRPVGGEESRKGCHLRREASGQGWDILREDIAQCPSLARLATRPPILSCHCGPGCLSSSYCQVTGGRGAQFTWRTRTLCWPEASFVYRPTRTMMLPSQQFLGKIWWPGTLV